MSELGLFPLGIVLLPSEQIPLHIFEDRYQELIGECLDEDREFGLIYADDDGLREIGTRAAVTQVLERFEDGRLNIVVEGRDRFRLLERGVLVAPERVGRLQFPFGGQLLPQLRGSGDLRRRVSHGRIDTLT